MVDIAFFGKTVPLAGQRKQPSASPITKLVWPTYERLNDGRYVVKHWMQDRCCNAIEMGSREVHVMNDHGYSVFVEDGGRAWY